MHLLELMFETSRDIIVITTSAQEDLVNAALHTPIVYANPAFTKLVDCTLSEVIGRTRSSLQGDRIHAISDPSHLTIHRVELHSDRQNGEPYWGELSLSPITNQAGEQTHWLIIERDITEHKQKEALLTGQLQQITDSCQLNAIALTQVKQTLQDKKDLLQLFMDNIHQQIFWKDRNSVFQGCNTNWAKAAKLESTEFIIGKTDYDLLPNREVADRYRAQDRQIMESNTPILHAIEIKQKKDEKGQQRWLDVSKIPFHNSMGEVVGLLCTIEDITERKLAEDALKASEEKLRSIFENAPIGIVLCDVHGSFVEANPTFCHMLDYTEAELKKLTFQELTYPFDLHQELSYVQKCLQNEVNQFQLEKRFVRKDKQKVWVKLLVSMIRDEFDRPLYSLAMVEDINDRKESEEALRQSEERFRKIFEEGPLGMAIIGFNQRLIKVNHMLCQMLGYSEIELMSRPFNSLTHPADAIKDAILAKQLYYGKIPQYQIEKRCIKKNREEIWVLLTAYVVHDQNGKTMHSLAMIRDITKQKQAQELIAASLREKEVLIKEIHHRVKNNLHVIANLLDLQSQYIEDEKILSLFSDCQNRIHSMALIHEQLYQSSTVGEVNFNEYIQSLIDNLFDSFSTHTNDIKQEIDAEAITLNMETSIPCGLIINELVSNSLKYAFPERQGGLIRIRFYADYNTNDKVLHLIVRDNGIGMNRDFDWQNSGTLGLRLVRILTRQLEGNLEVDTSNGTQFHLSFKELKYRERLHAHD
ncbi:PAS domain S-box protein [Tumidithrix elongata RA019]|uniref:PAS domain S-box protein n=2 Tax=Tumidithrix TaxID=3088355 RepID=A0AAW9Q6Y7_9CYAN|nr:PAS domain S-box protein [Tumidithrix elongata RA019]